MPEIEAYEFPEADVIALTRVDYDECVKVRDADGAHVADGYVEVEDAHLPR